MSDALIRIYLVYVLCICGTYAYIHTYIKTDEKWQLGAALPPSAAICGAHSISLSAGSSFSSRHWSNRWQSVIIHHRNQRKKLIIVPGEPGCLTLCFFFCQITVTNGNCNTLAMFFFVFKCKITSHYLPASSVFIYGFQRIYDASWGVQKWLGLGTTTKDSYYTRYELISWGISDWKYIYIF